MLFLGCDSGSTKIAFAVADDTGHVLVRTEFPAITLFRGGAETYASDMERCVRSVLIQAGIEAGQLTSAAFGLTGYGETVTSVAEMRAAVEGALPGVRCFLANDSVAGWSGALRASPGIHVVSGTGSVAYGEDGHGGAERAGGWSLYYGDEGSCYWIGVQGINAFFRQADGRMPRTLLYDYMMDLFHLSDPLFVCGAFEEMTHGGSADQVAAFQRHVLRLYHLGDPVAKSIYERAAEQLSLLVSSLKSRLHFDEGRPVRVSWSGGLFRAGDCILVPFKQFLQALGCEPTAPAYGPLAGAVGYAARTVLSPDQVNTVMDAVDRAASSAI
ncbi:MAG: hypothetical protein K6A68_08525 [Clostridiales bacterium]|nr:hypothetical protein [Clostridiales bacterium]